MASVTKSTAVVDPAWQGWVGIFMIVCVVFCLPIGCGPGTPVAQPEEPTKFNPLAEKLPKLKASLVVVEKRRDQLQDLRIKLETQRVALLEKLRKEGVTSTTQREGLSPVARAHLDEFVAVVRDMKEVKAQYEETKGKVAQIESMVHSLERRLTLDDALASDEDLQKFEEAEILLTDVEDRLKPAGGEDPLEAFETDALLQEQLGSEK